MTLGTDFESTLLAARTGAEWAWRHLYNDLAPTVLRYLRSRGAPDPEDITGEVFLQVVRRLQQFEGAEGDFRAWVMTIARHRYIDALRSRSRRPVDAVDDEILTLARAAGDVEGEALENLVTGDLRAAMTRLSPDQRDVLFLRVLAGLSIAEVAAATGKTPGAVKSLQARAVKALRRKLPHAIYQPKAVS